MTSLCARVEGVPEADAHEVQPQERYAHETGTLGNLRNLGTLPLYSITPCGTTTYKMRRGSENSLGNPVSGSKFQVLLDFARLPFSVPRSRSLFPPLPLGTMSIGFRVSAPWLLIVYLSTVPKGFHDGV